MAGLSDKEVTRLTWVRCYKGDLLNLETGAKVCLEPGVNGLMVVHRMPGDKEHVICPAVSSDEAETVLERIASKTVGHGESRCDVRPGVGLPIKIS